MPTDLSVAELHSVAKLLKTQQVPDTILINWFRPAPGILVVEWIEGEVEDLKNARWRHFDVGSGIEIEMDKIT